MITNDLHARIIEVRQYLLHENRRDDLISLFDRSFIEPQEEAGMTIIGQFRVESDPKRFFWLRGFPSMDARVNSLKEFYEGTVWRANRDAANETMIDSDNVLLLHAAQPGTGFDLEQRVRPAPDDSGPLDRDYVATIFNFEEPIESEFLPHFESRFAVAMKKLGMEPVAVLVTERSANTFPKLPVREDANALVALSTFSDESSFNAIYQSLQSWEKSDDAFARRLRDPVDMLHLTPTARSLLR